MEWDEALEFLFSRVNYERRPPDRPSRRTFELAPMRKFLAILGNPHLQVPVVHIAGTKGKGSTAAMIAACLVAAGYKTGLCTSPHLSRVEERFVVDGAECSRGELVELVETVRAAAASMEHGERLTFFELTTAIAFLHFQRSAADVAVVEVGLGGRLDSTNVCEPAVSVITSISYDHTRLLGNTLAEIATEKAGIIKASIPVVSGVLDPEPRAVIQAACRERQADLWETGTTFSGSYRKLASLNGALPRGQVVLAGEGLPAEWRHMPFDLGLVGAHQANNAAVAAATLARLIQQGWSIPTAALAEGLAKVRWPARFELVRQRPAVVIDAAHNLASAAALLATLQTHTAPRRRWLMFATSRDKDPAGMLAILAPWFDQIVLTQYQNNPRGVSPDELAAAAVQVGCDPGKLIVAPSPEVAWKQAQAGMQADDLLCIAGSLFLAAEMRERLAAEEAPNPLPASV